MAYTAIDKPSDYFVTKLYTGTGSSLANTGVGFQSDFTWIKGRSGTTEHVLTDAVRGVTKELNSNDNTAEETVAQGLTAFGSDGFTVGTDASYNTSSATYASWNWKANGAGATNEDGSINTTKTSASTTSGFSISTYTGTGANATVGHGLGVAPKMVICKKLNGGDGWFVYNEANGNDKYIFLDTSTAVSGSSVGFWNSTSPTSATVSLGTNGAVNASSATYVAYCFADVQGYSKFGSYTGNGSTDGTFVYTGFKPAWILTIRTNGNYKRLISDNKRNPFNAVNTYLSVEYGDADASGIDLDFLSNGFKLKTTDVQRNASGSPYIYMAFAEEPLVTSTGIPATAR